MPDHILPVTNEILLWSEIARNLGILFGGVVGVGIAWWRSRAANLQAQAALEQSELARRDHITEIFNRAVGQLADDKLEVRLGAIYTLRALCEERNYGAYINPVIQTLSAFVREYGAAPDGEVPVDVRAITELVVEVTKKAKGDKNGGSPHQS